MGLVTEGASSVAFVRRMGIAKANEALILSKRISAQELLETGFVNKLFPSQPDGGFRETVLAYVKDQFGDHLNDESMLKAKALIRAPEMDLMEQQNAKQLASAKIRPRSSSLPSPRAAPFGATIVREPMATGAVPFVRYFAPRLFEGRELPVDGQERDRKYDPAYRRPEHSDPGPISTRSSVLIRYMRRSARE